MILNVLTLSDPYHDTVRPVGVDFGAVYFLSESFGVSVGSTITFADSDAIRVLPTTLNVGFHWRHRR